jgi:hypothetical protein
VGKCSIPAVQIHIHGFVGFASARFATIGMTTPLSAACGICHRRQLQRMGGHGNQVMAVDCEKPSGVSSVATARHKELGPGKQRPQPSTQKVMNRVTARLTARDARGNGLEASGTGF